jgi:hypothetical protein
MHNRDIWHCSPECLPMIRNGVQIITAQTARWRHVSGVRHSNRAPQSRS